MCELTPLHLEFDIIAFKDGRVEITVNSKELQPHAITLFDDDGAGRPGIAADLPLTVRVRRIEPIACPLIETLVQLMGMRRVWRAIHMTI